MRADKFFSERFGSRTRAKDALSKGLVTRGDAPVAPDDEIAPETSIEAFRFADGDAFASRGGDKLERGLSRFGESVEGAVAADLGASTGGFTDCLLRRGARRVYAVDVGRSQLEARIASDGRVVVMDGTNARNLTADDFPERIDVVTADLSFISLRLVLPAVRSVLKDGGRAFVLFKPQFECGGRGLKRNGILPVSRHRPLLEGIRADARALGFSVRDVAVAPVRPGKNVEYVLFLATEGDDLPSEEFFSRAEKFC